MLEIKIDDTNLCSLEKNRRLLMECYNSMENDIKTNYDKSDYNVSVLKETLCYIKVGIKHIEEAQDKRDRILHEGKRE